MMMVCQYQYKMDISVWAMRVRCTTIITFSSVLFPFPIVISNTCHSWHAHHVNGRTTSANGWSFYVRHVSDFGFKGFLGVVLLASCSVYFGYTECVPVIGPHFPPECVPPIDLHLPCIQSNDLSYTVFVCQVSSPMNGANVYIMHSESRLCRSAVTPLRFVRSNGLFQHHTSHKRRHQGSR